MFTDVACQLLRLGERTEATKRLHTIKKSSYKTPEYFQVSGEIEIQQTSENTF